MKEERELSVGLKSLVRTWLSDSPEQIVSDYHQSLTQMLVELEQRVNVKSHVGIGNWLIGKLVQTVGLGNTVTRMHIQQVGSGREKKRALALYTLFVDTILEQLGREMPSLKSRAATDDQHNVAVIAKMLEEKDTLIHFVLFREYVLYSPDLVGVATDIEITRYLMAVASLTLRNPFSNSPNKITFDLLHHLDVLEASWIYGLSWRLSVSESVKLGEAFHSHIKLNYGKPKTDDVSPVPFQERMRAWTRLVQAYEASRNMMVRHLAWIRGGIAGDRRRNFDPDWLEQNFYRLGELVRESFEDTTTTAIFDWRPPAGERLAYSYRYRDFPADYEIAALKEVVDAIRMVISYVDGYGGLSGERLEMAQVAVWAYYGLMMGLYDLKEA